ncbi:hypothetical protein L1887_25824 [Cichorium endivia]|nr:hypothetical protein L1887_25824 [Cichorium endivia]
MNPPAHHPNAYNERANSCREQYQTATLRRLLTLRIRRRKTQVKFDDITKSVCAKSCNCEEASSETRKFP